MDSTTVCNLALGKIGDQSITSLDDPTPEARFCKLYYDQTAAELFRVHDWNWATGLATLSQLATDPAFAWDNAFQLPADFGRILTLNAFGEGQAHQLFEIVGDQLLTDEGCAQITYIKNVVDPSLFDPLFVEVLALKIGAKLAKPLGGSMDIQARLLQEFKVALAEARRIDAQDGYPRRKPLWVDADVVRARYSYVN